MKFHRCKVKCLYLACSLEEPIHLDYTWKFWKQNKGWEVMFLSVVIWKHLTIYWLKYKTLKGLKIGSAWLSQCFSNVNPLGILLKWRFWFDKFRWAPRFCISLKFLDDVIANGLHSILISKCIWLVRPSK